MRYQAALRFGPSPPLAGPRRRRNAPVTAPLPLSGPMGEDARARLPAPPALLAKACAAFGFPPEAPAAPPQHRRRHRQCGLRLPPGAKTEPPGAPSRAWEAAARRFPPPLGRKRPALPAGVEEYHRPGGRRPRATNVARL